MDKNMEYKKGQMIEVSEDGKKWKKREFISIIDLGVIVFRKGNNMVAIFKHHRVIQPPSMIGLLGRFWDEEDEWKDISTLIEHDSSGEYPYKSEYDRYHNFQPITSTELNTYLQKTKEYESKQD